ncbi:hypothetical protein [Streptomyces sp. 891-h]|uniref:hypothetical protein n=1 Tax=Streptomyces sp. 891-h TaxID=2720714 RepID=UPI001FAAB7D2|nr:hypothetical protein [Streptomyces sp. 891-h]UNZ20859.1 hypothetical protein HC362_31065 [Streptomyces sp. 891-h]
MVSGDTDRARTAMRAQLRTVFSDIEGSRAHSPQPFAGDPTAVPVRRSVAVRE